jgi:tetratricopeptide (TPR) repeat protein
MRLYRISFIFIILLIFSQAGAADNRELWDQAAGCYDAGDYSSAISVYNQLIERGLINASIYHNLGNSYFKNGQMGSAIWSYRRALRLDPAFEPARTNLDFARRMNIDKIEAGNGNFISDIWDFLSKLLGLNGYLMVFTMAWWTLGALAVLLIYRGNFASWPYYLLIVSAIIGIFSAAAAARRIKIDRLTSWGVLVNEAADIREGPGKDFERIEIGHEGLEFMILSERENSYLIELSNGLKGWINKEAVLKI